MEKIIEIDLLEKEDFIEKYNNRKISKSLIEYMMDEAMFIGKKDTIKIEIHNDCNLEIDIVKMIKDGLEIEYQKNIKNRKLNNIKQFILLLIGIIFLCLSTLMKEGFIFQEVFLIIGWVPIWEAIEIELFTDVKEKRKRQVLKKLLDGTIEIVN